jgi:hypothetical protein
VLKASFLAYMDAFWVLMLLALAAVPLVLSLRNVKLGGRGALGGNRSPKLLPETVPALLLKLDLAAATLFVNGTCSSCSPRMLHVMPELQSRSRGRSIDLRRASSGNLQRRGSRIRSTIDLAWASPMGRAYS